MMLLIKTISLFISGAGALLGILSDFRYKSGSRKGKISLAGRTAIFLILFGMSINITAIIIESNNAKTTRANLEQQAEAQKQTLANLTKVSNDLVSARNENKQLSEKLNEANNSLNFLSYQLLTSMDIKKLDITWTFNNVPKELEMLFTQGHKKVLEFWDNIDMIDYPNGSIEDAQNVEHIFQSLIKAIATGDAIYPIDDISTVENKYQIDEIKRRNKSDYCLLFPMNAALDNAIVLGQKEEKKKLDSDNDYLFPSEKFPNDAVKYNYTANASLDNNILKLYFGNHPLLFHSTNRKTSISTQKNFNIILPDSEEECISAMKYLNPEFWINGNWGVYESKSVNWTSESEISIIVNGLKDFPIRYKVKRKGRYAHAPLYTDEDESMVDYFFTIYLCELIQPDDK